jgi:hypothetical protein
VPDVARVADQVERDVLYLLMDPEFKGPWTVAEIGREIGSQLFARDAVRSLCEAGLAHRSGETVFASRAAARCFVLMQQ